MPEQNQQQEDFAPSDSRRSNQEPNEEEPHDEAAESGLSFTDSEAKRSAVHRETYIRNMNSKFSHQLNQEIKRISLKDLKMRDVKSANNEDKLFDYIKIKDIRKDNS